MLIRSKSACQLERRNEAREEGRLPPGQSLTLKWPVLHEGSIPQFDPAHWDLRVFGLIRNSVKLSWEEFNRLPRITTTSDFHCVTRWSRFDNHWQGVAFREVIKSAEPQPEAHSSWCTPSRDTRRMSRWPTLIVTMFCWLRTTTGSP